jgi:hypothetical protein
VYREDIIREALDGKTWGVLRSNLRNADDTTLLASSKKEL